MGYQSFELIAQCTQLDLKSIGDQMLQVSPSIIASKYIIKRIVVTNLTGTITGAAGGLYTSPNKGGTIIVAATQLYATLIANRTFDLTLAANISIMVLSSPMLYLSLTTASTTVAKADFYIIGDIF